MKTLIASMILSVIFLSAGTILGAELRAGRLAATAVAKPGNVTIVNKNQAWPLAGRISVEPCNQRRCIGI